MLRSRRAEFTATLAWNRLKSTWTALLAAASVIALTGLIATHLAGSHPGESSRATLLASLSLPPICMSTDDKSE